MAMCFRGTNQECMYNSDCDIRERVTKLAARCGLACSCSSLFTLDPPSSSALGIQFEHIATVDPCTPSTGSALSPLVAVWHAVTQPRCMCTPASVWHLHPFSLSLLLLTACHNLLLNTPPTHLLNPALCSTYYMPAWFKSNPESQPKSVHRHSLRALAPTNLNWHQDLLRRSPQAIRFLSSLVIPRPTMMSWLNTPSVTYHTSIRQPFISTTCWLHFV